VQFRVGSQLVTVNSASRDALFAAVAARLAARQGFALATLNLDHLVKLRRSARFRDAYAAQDLVVADGHPVIWLSHLARSPVQLLPGSEIVVPLAAEAARAGVPVALVGTTGPALQAAATVLRRVVPGLDVAFCFAPPMGFDVEGVSADDLLADLSRRGIGLCFVALGAPKQEILAARGRALAPDVGFVSVGAGLDFLAGTQVRAPLWVRKLSLEWLWRAGQSPSRMIPRYAACAALLPVLAVDAIRLRGRSWLTCIRSILARARATGQADSRLPRTPRRTCPTQKSTPKPNRRAAPTAPPVPDRPAPAAAPKA